MPNTSAAKPNAKVPYGVPFSRPVPTFHFANAYDRVVRLGNSGLKVSKIILGTMQYGSPEWQDWVLGEEEAIKHIKAA